MTETVQVKLTTQQLDVVAAGLGKLPMEVALPVFQALQMQLATAKEEAAAAAELNRVAGRAQ